MRGGGHLVDDACPRPKQKQKNTQTKPNKPTKKGGAAVAQWLTDKLWPVVEKNWQQGGAAAAAPEAASAAAYLEADYALLSEKNGFMGMGAFSFCFLFCFVFLGGGSLRLCWYVATRI